MFCKLTLRLTKRKYKCITIKATYVRYGSQLAGDSYFRCRVKVYRRPTGSMVEKACLYLY